MSVQASSFPWPYSKLGAGSRLAAAPPSSSGGSTNSSRSASRPASYLLSRYARSVGQAVHFAILSKYVQLDPNLTAVWLLLPCLVCSLYVFSPRRELKWLVLSILLCAVVYLTWWLFVTPTMKAWPRRIFNGAILINLLLVFACYAGNALPVFGRRAAAALSALSILAACAFFVHSALHGFCGPGRAEPPSSRKRWKLSSNCRAVRRSSATAGTQRRARALFRPDCHGHRHGAAGRAREAVATAMDAPAMSAKAFDDYLGRFKHRAVFIGRWFQVHEVDFGSRLDWAKPLRNPGQP